MNRLLKIVTLCLFVFLLGACAPSSFSIQTAIAHTQIAWTPIPTQTAYPTYTPKATYTTAPTIYVTKIVTPTFTATPLNTPTATLSPTATVSPTPTKSSLMTDKKDGFYLIGIEIAPGVWRAAGPGNDCYWSVTSRTGKVIDISIGTVGMTAYLPETGFQVQFNGCNTWIYLGP